MSSVLDWRWLASPEDTVELCELFFTHNSAARHPSARAARSQNAQQAATQPANMGPDVESGERG